MELQIVKTEDKVRGKLYDVNIEGKRIELLMTWHALDRMKIWKLDINQVLSALLHPEEVVTGHHRRYIAHKRYGEHILRVVYESKDSPVVITVYFPSTKRYFAGGGTYADKILS